MSALVLLLLARSALGYLSPLCCGDNFCCAITSSDKTQCWGGSKRWNGAAVPTGTKVHGLTCGGKAVLGIDNVRD